MILTNKQITFRSFVVVLLGILKPILFIRVKFFMLFVKE